MDINTRQLRYFMEVAEELNFTRAALNLYIAQPTLSQQIADLETQLGVTLFRRTSRTVSLTPAGQALYESCGDLLDHIDAVHRRVLRAESGEQGELKIGCLGDPYRKTLPGIMRFFSDAYPQVTLELHQGTIGSLGRDVDSGRLDAAFTFAYPRLSGSHRSGPCVELGREDLCLCISRTHPYARTEHVDYAALDHEIMYVIDETCAPDWNTVVLDTCASINLCPSAHVPVKRVESILMQVEAGMGIALLPASLADANGQNILFLPVNRDCLTRILLWNPDCANPSLPLFTETLEEYLSRAKQENSMEEKES